ncbi:type II toxin-antitoxin system RelE/ParE family toxin [Pseudoalteromonas sp. ND6B]|mgnify:FL=1|uniref:type II toxin-antitoxin system RelE/ParE family toxin n=1 Tax=Pseudoalteromonas sp. ND6B TaxID=1535421 RepID=UPI00051A7009|nr:type II toxin-antitoxin system RelE/ParE family toxin [Pseudoalteromonas sp. ND6B]KGJ99130.1 plasmid stabilization system [Pseudoalteromonas sp. ND6B]MAY58848.1 type II toxin-antitoxin system RelE/ParE family toxin [Pseudoalteromonas sp.]
MRTFKLSNDAKEDLRRIYQYGCKAFSQQQADIYFYSFFSMFEKLAANPYSYQSVDHIRTGYRRAVCGSDSIYYRISATDVEIMAILGGQDTDEWL